MILSLSGAVAGAAALWRRDRDLLVRIAAAFFFLPSFAMLLFLPDMPRVAEGADPMPVMIAYLSSNAHWLALEQAVELFGAASLFALYLGSDRPTLGGAMRHAVRRFPAFVVASVLGFLLFFGGLLMFFVPGFYVAGRTFLLGPAVLGSGRSDPISALDRSFRVTRGHGWMLFTAIVVAMVPSYMIAILAGSLQQSLGGGQVAVALAAVIAAGASAATMLALALLRVVAYRRLSSGI